jgi:hypothetical protein
MISLMDAGGLSGGTVDDFTNGHHIGTLRDRDNK